MERDPQYYNLVLLLESSTPIIDPASSPMGPPSKPPAIAMPAPVIASLVAFEGLLGTATSASFNTERAASAASKIALGRTPNAVANASSCGAVRSPSPSSIRDTVDWDTPLLRASSTWVISFSRRRVAMAMPSKHVYGSSAPPRCDRICSTRSRNCVGSVIIYLGRPRGINGTVNLNPSLCLS